MCITSRGGIVTRYLHYTVHCWTMTLPVLSEVITTKMMQQLYPVVQNAALGGEEMLAS